jgi:hypothetical protein
MKNKVVRLTESDLVRIIEKVISEQGTVGTNFQQGVQSGAQAGQQARQVVNKVAGDVAQGAKKVGTAAVQAGVATLQGAKQVAITIGKVTFYAIITGGVVVFMIGKGIYKVSAAVGNAIIKFFVKFLCYLFNSLFFRKTFYIITRKAIFINNLVKF